MTPTPIRRRAKSAPAEVRPTTVLSAIPVTELSLRDTHRLIPSRFSQAGTVLSRLAASPETMGSLMELDDATNDRFLGEEGLLSGIGIHELVYGVRYAHIVNAAFTHASPSGGRFNSATRGCWYAAIDRPTALTEVAFHRTRQLEEIDWTVPETSTVDDYLADLTSTMHDLRTPAAIASRSTSSPAAAPASATGLPAAPSPFVPYLEPDPIPACYAAPQQLAASLLRERSNGIVYPSVRRGGGTCVACFRPPLVYNVRRAARLELTVTAHRPFRPAHAREVPIDDL